MMDQIKEFMAADKFDKIHMLDDMAGVRHGYYTPKVEEYSAMFWHHLFNYCCNWELYDDDPII